MPVLVQTLLDVLTVLAGAYVAVVLYLVRKEDKEQ